MIHTNTYNTQTKLLHCCIAVRKGCKNLCSALRILISGY